MHPQQDRLRIWLGHETEVQTCGTSTKSSSGLNGDGDSSDRSRLVPLSEMRLIIMEKCEPRNTYHWSIETARRREPRRLLAPAPFVTSRPATSVRNHNLPALGHSMNTVSSTMTLSNHPDYLHPSCLDGFFPCHVAGSEADAERVPEAGGSGRHPRPDASGKDTVAVGGVQGEQHSDPCVRIKFMPQMHACGNVT